MLEDYMQKAIQEAYDGIKKGDGGCDCKKR